MYTFLSFLVGFFMFGSISAITCIAVWIIYNAICDMIDSD